MSLTVPKAGISPGRAPQLANVPVPQSDAGATLAAFGDRMAQVGKAMETDRLQRELQTARVDMMEGMNAIRLEFEQMGDPDAVDQQFKPRTDELKAQILGNLDQRNQQDAGLMFDELRTSHGFALGARAIELRQSQRMATLARTTDTVVRTGATADPETQAAYMAQLEDHLSYLVASGTITPEDAETRRQSAAADMEAARATRLLSDDPAALIAAIDRGAEAGFGHMDPERMQGFRARAASAIAAAETAAQSEAERAAKEHLSAAKDVLKDGISVFGKGRDWSGVDDAEALLQNPEVAAMPEARQYAHAKLLHQHMPGFAALPLAEQRKRLAEAKALPIEKGYEADLAEAMQSSIAAAEAGFRDDRFAYAREIGLKPAADLPDPLNATPDELAVSLRGRANYATSLRDAGYTRDVKFFSPDEAEAWKAAVAAERSPAERAKLASAMAVALGSVAEDAAEEIGADPLFTYVGGLIAHGGNETLARQIFDGQRALDAKDTRMPAAPMRRDAFFREFNTLFEDGTVDGRADEAAVRDQIIAAADALYAYRRRGDPNATDAALNEELYQQAIHEVMGGTGSFKSGDARGGVQKIRGQLTLMPQGMSGADVEDAFDVLRAGLPDGELVDKAWRDISASGNTPRAGGQPINAKTFSRLSLRQVTGSAYEMVVENPATGRLEALYGDDGKPYLVDLKKMVDVFVEGKTSPTKTPPFAPFDPMKNTARDNGDGSFSTEIVITTESPDGQIWNIPSLWWREDGTSIELPQEQAIALARRYEQTSGKRFPRFKTISEAEQAAVRRSDAGGGLHGAITQ
ncbi:hypothetical protein [Paenirhodobacter sp. CAU 1674]|uniref:hypothetical protein n=1 Tax=Paenirhodobacter sp. CAU 1674 TaxID=3032596 RepID=UPI0023DCBC7B|nr:hypothetical protein [Paenirhodobacter sp. CAU 1674]MDF2143197.1 hypothetical protein [Paenirhodobacter sp. CAU 1674]